MGAMGAMGSVSPKSEQLMNSAVEIFILKILSVP
jgi:hypothetical protein